MKGMIWWQIFKLFFWLIFKIRFYPEYKIHANELFLLIADNKYWQIIPDLFKNIFYKKIEMIGKQDRYKLLSSFLLSCVFSYLSQKAFCISTGYLPNFVRMDCVTKYRLCKKFDCKQILKGLFWNPLTAAIELKFNKTQIKE